MRIHLYLLAIICGLFAAATTTRGQVQSPLVATQTTEGAPTNPAEQRVTASKILEEVAAQLDLLNCVENRSMLRAKTAGLLWKSDEGRARTLLRQSIADLGAISFDENVPTHQSGNERQAAMNLRGQVLQMVAQRDALLALELLRSSAGTLPWVAQFNQPPNNYDGQMETSLAHQVALENPQLALKLAEARLEKGLSVEVISVLAQLREKDAPAATKLAGSIMARLRRTDPKVERQAVHTAVSLLSR